MYQTAESMVDAGDYADAVRLMRHSILSLPRRAETDELRHALVMRMAHVQLLRTFLNQFMLVPAQVVRTGRRLVFRLLAFRPRLHTLARLLNAI